MSLFERILRRKKSQATTPQESGQEKSQNKLRKKRLPPEYQVRIVTEFKKKELQNLMENYELTATELNLVGTAFRNLDEPGLTEAALKESISKDPCYDEPYGNLISLYCSQERYDQCRSVLDDALRNARKDSYVWYHYGRMSAISGDYDSAVEAAYAALKGENYEFEAAYELGVHAIFSRIKHQKSKNPEKDLEDAHNLLKVGLSKFPESAELKELSKFFEDD